MGVGGVYHGILQCNYGYVLEQTKLQKHCLAASVTAHFLSSSLCSSTKGEQRTGSECKSENVESMVSSAVVRLRN